MEFDPRTCVIEADLSRADVVLLYELCRDRRVIEFGAGGSTVLLGRVAKSVESYETSSEWVKLVLARHQKEKGNLCPIRVHLIGPGKVPAAEPADVLFVDGKRHLRGAWVRAALRRELVVGTVVVHDSRHSLEHLSCLLEWPLHAWIHQVTYHAQNSNCLVITLRGAPVEYENWNRTETTNRLPHLHLQGPPKRRRRR